MTVGLIFFFLLVAFVGASIKGYIEWKKVHDEFRDEFGEEL